MRNLRNIHRSLVQSSPGLKLTAVALDTPSQNIICAFGPTKDNPVLELRRWDDREKTLSPIASWDAPCPAPDIECDEILNLQFFPESSTACLVLAGGDIIVVREKPQPGEEKIEIVGTADVGISAASWSPDEDLLAITTKAATLLYMTRDFESITYVIFSSEDLKVSSHVSVGWGKKETQFKGKKARALRDPTIPETVDEGVLSEFDTRQTTISWRGDGSYLAVNSIESDSRRVIRVYTREGSLDSVSEPVDGLVSALSWRPAGNLLAGLQYRDGSVRVVFFERNGLRHGQFDLRLSEEEVRDWGSNVSLSWNIDSSVLAVCYTDRVQLWTMSNYHYYLKQEVLALSRKSTPKPVNLVWNSENPLEFVMGTIDGVQKLAYSSVVCCGPTARFEDYGVVAVIDGKTLKVTPMRLSNVPPPMALHEINLESNAIDVMITVDHRNTRSILIGVLHHQGVALYEWPVTSMMHQAPSHKWTKKPMSDADQSSLMYLQGAFGRQRNQQICLLLLSHDVETSTVSIMTWEGHMLDKLCSRSRTIRRIITNGPHTDSGTHIVAESKGDQTGDDVERDISRLNEEFELEFKFASFGMRTVESVRYAGTPDVSFDEAPPREEITFSLLENGSLRANERLLVRNCTSFLITPVHLIFTTSQHLLKFVHMANSTEGLEVPPDAPENDERCRNIERGAKLVTVMPSIFALVLQMPRGNLETIYPRALVLVGIRSNINEKKYRKAFFACRNHRVDMNILHDHDPQQFLSNVRIFLDQVQKVEHIDLFLSQLRDEDVSKSMYKDTIRSVDHAAPSLDQTGEPSSSKVNRTCNAFLDALETRTSTHFQNVVTAHVCKIPPDLDAGLGQIAELRNKSPELVDSAIEHICFLADVNRLYDNALGLYDLRLALLIAQQSQKDPKEYLPFLQNLQKEPQLRRQWSIDNYLGRYQKALNHLCELNVFDEVKTFTVKHSLYSKALEYYRYQEDNLRELMRLHAEYLHQQGNFKEAGIAYEYLKDYPSASASYRQAHLWKESLSSATLIPLPSPQLHSLALTLADTLSESKDFSSAATIHADYLSDIPTSARLFCKGYHFADVLRIAGLHNRPDLLASIIDPGLIESMGTTTELLADCKSQLNAQIPRIRELRAKKAEDPLAFMEGDGNDGADIPDNVSLAPTDTSTTGGSLFTRYTNRTGTVGTNATRRTSKNRRREERKKARGKKGSIYEEEYLVNSVGRLIERVNAVNEEVERLVVGLMRRGMRERAVAVESAMEEVVALCRGCVGEVFGDGGEGKREDRKGVDEKEGEGDGRPRGGEGVVWDVLEGEKRRDVPVVNEFGKLSLLGQ